MAILGVIIAAVVGFLFFAVKSIASGLVGPVVDFIVNFSIQPLSIPYVNQVILWGQACAVVVVVGVRIWKGLYDVGLGRGGEFHEAFRPWAVKTALSIAGVAFMPIICSAIASLGTTMLEDVKLGISDTSVTAAFTAVTEDELDALWAMSMPDLGTVLAMLVLYVMVLFACVKVAYEMLKRQFVILEICVIAPWVSIKGSTDSADDYLDLVVSLFFLNVAQWMQYLFYVIALSTFTTYSAGATWLGSTLLTQDGIIGLLTVAAALGAALAVPSVIERYSFTVGRGGSAGMLVGMAVRGGIRGAGKTASAIGGFAKAATKTP